MKKQSNSSFYRMQKAPGNMQHTQEWFADVITTPLIDNQWIHPFAGGGLIAEEASKYVVPSPTLEPFQRMQIYNQQYWWRLLKTLHENYPLLTRLFGYEAFNESIALPYLIKYPPNHWDLNLLGASLCDWIKEAYQSQDKQLILSAAELDWTFIKSFLAADEETFSFDKIDVKNLEALLQLDFFLHPAVAFFSWDYDLLTFRELFLKENVEYWTEHDFPALPREKKYHFILYRGPRGNIYWKEISAAEQLLLSFFKNGEKIENACEKLDQTNALFFQEAEKNLQLWIYQWISKGWLVIPSHQHLTLAS